MRWIKPNFRSIFSTLGMAGHYDRESEVKERTEEVRLSMLDTLEGQSDSFAVIHRRIRYASDLSALWYLRGDLMGVLAAVYGEGEARAKIAEITLMFHGMLPGGLTSRPGSLGGR